MSEPTSAIASQTAYYLRRAIGAAFVQSGWMDRDDPDEADLLQFQNCEGCDKGRCACSGVPFLSSLIWDQLDKFGDLSKALAVHAEAATSELRVAEQHAHRADANRDEALAAEARAKANYLALKASNSSAYADLHDSWWRHNDTIVRLGVEINAVLVLLEDPGVPAGIREQAVAICKPWEAEAAGSAGGGSGGAS